MKSFRQYLKFFLKEAKSMMGYTSWGWMDPAGKIIEGDDDDKETKDYGGSHEGLILKLRLSGYDEAFRKGYVRWIISKGRENKMTASFSFEVRNNKQNILKELENIKNFLREKKQEINGEIYIECSTRTTPYDIFADDVLDALRKINSNMEKIRQNETNEIPKQEPDAYQVAFLKKLGHHKRD